VSLFFWSDCIALASGLSSFLKSCIFRVVTAFLWGCNVPGMPHTCTIMNGVHVIMWGVHGTEDSYISLLLSHDSRFLYLNPGSWQHVVWWDGYVHFYRWRQYLHPELCNVRKPIHESTVKSCSNYCQGSQWHTGGVSNPSPPPPPSRNSKVLTKLSWIPSSVENTSVTA
jgi:hypothetical protein